jgi:5'-methylthioadenosine phosphorylase
MLAIIGGSGLTQLANLEITHKQLVRTPYGECSGPVTFGRIGATEVAFLARHGYGHTLAPHEINYRANLWALHSRGVAHVLAVNAVGGIARDLGPGALVLPDQLIDYTWGRPNTYFEGSEQPVTHIDFTHPYDQEMRARVLAAAKEAGVEVKDGGCYAAVQGPRLETAAEVNRLERDGATMVGMTGMPEASLAKELGLRYVTLSVSANHAAGRGDSGQSVSMDQIARTLDDSMGRVRKIMERLVVAHGRS